MRIHSAPPSLTINTSESSGSEFKDRYSVSAALADNSLVDLENDSTVPLVVFPAGSIEEQCGLNHFPRRDSSFTELDASARSEFLSNLRTTDGDWLALGSEDCRAALDQHINSLNPYLLDATYEVSPYTFAFVKLEEPLTFERIFADPAGDFNRVQDALLRSRDECLLRGEEINWDLKETCHGSSMLNYALINRFCFHEVIQDGLGNPWLWGPELERSLWKLDLGYAWIRVQCAGVPPHLELNIEHNVDLTEVVYSYSDMNNFQDSFHEYFPHAVLIELAARLGDEAAGFTSSGHRYGRFEALLTSEEWYDFASVDLPSTDRFLTAFYMLESVLTNNTSVHDGLQFDWEFVVYHLCEKPVEMGYAWFYGNSNGDWPPPSCQEVVSELRQQTSLAPSIVKVLNKFEQVAVRLHLYD